MTVLSAYGPLILAGVCGVILVGIAFLGFICGRAEERAAVLGWLDSMRQHGDGYDDAYWQIRCAAHRKGDNA